MSCQEKSKKTTNSCTGTNYYQPGCPGYSPYGTTTGGVSGGTTGNNQLCYSSPTNYWQLPGCPGFCQNYPAHSSCGGSTTSGTTAGTTSGTTSGSTTGSTASGTNNGGTNPYTNYPSSSLSQNWGVQYPGGVPAENCSSSYAPTGINFTPYETRKATMSIQGKTFYNPASPIATQYMNTSAKLKSVANAKTLFETDAFLKVRFKPRPQPENTQTSPYCYIPAYSKMSSVAGYTKLSYSVILVGQKANGTIEEEPLGTFQTDVNSCSQGIDLSSYASTYPAGIYFKVQSVRGNQGAWPNDYHINGFKNSNAFSDVRSMDCWVIDVEVAADGTKTFD
jgi:hypothetical protein